MGFLEHVFTIALLSSTWTIWSGRVVLTLAVMIEAA